MRITPDSKYNGMPCSYVSTGCAYEDMYRKPFPVDVSEHVKADGWLTLNDMNAYIRAVLPVKKKTYYKRNERMTLREFLLQNEDNCIVCVAGHFIYVDNANYWSFFNNEDDSVICIWKL